MGTVEAAIAVYLIRFGLSVAGITISIMCWLRISRSERMKANLPEDTTAKIAGLRHEVAELNESLSCHIAKDNARQQDRTKRRERAEPALAAPEAAPPRQMSEPEIKAALNVAASEANDRARSGRGVHAH
jgi:hypothetical protein